MDEVAPSKRVTKRSHPGAGRRVARSTPKGRQVDPQALETIRDILAELPRRRDLLIEYLHLLQDRFGHLSASHLVALAEELRLALSEVYEVATFYAHFDVVKEGETPPPPITVRVCDSISCELAGSRSLLEELAEAADDRVRVVRAPCMGRCDAAPAAEVGHNCIQGATADSVRRAIDAGRIHAELPDYLDFDRYTQQGGYQLLRQCLSGAKQREEIISAVEQSELKGLGGAGFPTGRKWRIVRDFPRPRLFAVNADEGEPGTFKDRYYMETDPHRFLEGTLIAMWAVEADRCYIYLRDEYPAVREILLREIARLESEKVVPQDAIVLRRGAGAYICGEESAMIESIEGKRGLPRNRPPYVAEVGLFNRPTLVNNVETLYWVRDICEKGSEWFAGAGRNGGRGWRSYSVSGRVRDPGVKLAPAGISVKALIDEYCGGMLEGHTFKAYLPGGASGGILPAELGDEPLDFGTLEQHGCFIGSAAVVVISDHDSMRDVALNLLRFFEDESCGQCTPCRLGTHKAVRLMSASKWDAELLSDLSRAMADASICGLGQAAGNPIDCVLKYFPEEVA